MKQWRILDKKFDSQQFDLMGSCYDICGALVNLLHEPFTSKTYSFPGVAGIIWVSGLVFCDLCYLNDSFLYALSVFVSAHTVVSTVVSTVNAPRRMG